MFWNGFLKTCLSNNFPLVAKIVFSLREIQFRKLVWHMLKFIVGIADHIVLWNSIISPFPIIVWFKVAELTVCDFINSQEIEICSYIHNTYNVQSGYIYWNCQLAIHNSRNSPSPSQSHTWNEWSQVSLCDMPVILVLISTK